MNPSTSSEGKFLRIDGLVKRFGEVTAVDEVSLTINKGEIFALLGSSGCGKTTLLRVLAGFERATSGRVTLEGVDIASLPPYERPINMMFQSYALFPHLNVWDNVAFGLKRQSMPKAQIDVKVQEMLQLVRLESFAKRKPHQLSGGQQQRVALARSLARQPKLLLLDEPLGALDKKLREQTRFELVAILQSVGVTCVMVTHDQEEAMSMASRIAVMSNGRVLQVGTPREIYELPNCRFVADFIGNVNLLDGQIAHNDAGRYEVTTADGMVRVGHGNTISVGTPVAIAVRPERIRISKAKPEVGYNLFSGKVRDVAYFGSYNTYIVEISQNKTLKIMEANSARPDSLVIAKEDPVFIWWEESAPTLLMN